MKSSWQQFIDAFEFRHLIITVVSLLSAIRAKADNEMGWWHRAGNITAGFLIAGLVGMILLEKGWLPWASGGVSYLMGQIGNRAMNAIINAIKKAEVDLFGFLRQVVEFFKQVLDLYLIWRDKPGNNGTQP